MHYENKKFAYFVFIKYAVRTRVISENFRYAECRSWLLFHFKNMHAVHNE